jgi:GxxExxY protein
MSWSKRESPSKASRNSRCLQSVQFDEGFRADILVDRQLIIEIKAVANILPAHDAQVLTYLRKSGLRLGLLFNFHARLLKDGLRRFVV